MNLTIQEEFLMSYLYFGWFAPDGVLVLPTLENKKSSQSYSHFEILPNRFNSLFDAYNAGYIRFFTLRNAPKTLVLSGVLERFDKRTVILGVKNLHNLIISGKLEKLFSQLPLPEKFIFELNPLNYSGGKRRIYFESESEEEFIQRIRILSPEKENIEEEIVKRGGKYYLYSKKSHKKLGGPYNTRDEALKRERQVQYFKHAKNY